MGCDSCRSFYPHSVHVVLVWLRWLVTRAAYRRQQRAAEWGVSENFTPYQRGRVKKQFQRRCFRCQATKRLCVDHHLPLSAGYPLAYGNAVILCRSCNAKKGTKLPEAFYTVKQLTILADLLAAQKTWGSRNSSKRTILR